MKLDVRWIGHMVIPLWICSAHWIWCNCRLQGQGMIRISVVYSLISFFYFSICTNTLTLFFWWCWVWSSFLCMKQCINSCASCVKTKNKISFSCICYTTCVLSVELKEKKQKQTGIIHARIKKAFESLLPRATALRWKHHVRPLWHNGIFEKPREHVQILSAGPFKGCKCRYHNICKEILVPLLVKHWPITDAQGGCIID